MGKMDGIVCPSNSSAQCNLSSDHVGANNVVQQNDPSSCSPSFCAYQQEDRSVKQISPCSPSFTSIYAPSNEPDLMRNNDVACKDEMSATYNVVSQHSETGQSTNIIPSSFTGLAQRFLASTLQRKASLTYADIPVPTRIADLEGWKSEEICAPNNCKEAQAGVVSQDSNEESTKEKIGHESLKKPTTHYAEQSSPPLEHMKISFHPMNGLESKLKLEFPNGYLHESIEDLMFPSFQLRPGPAVASPESGSDSDDDAFCRSCPYSSEDLLSPRSYSNSELWEQDERNGCKDHELYGDSHGISSSTTSISSYMRFEQLNHSNKDTVSGFGNLETEKGTMSFHSGSIIDLRGLESVVSLKNQQERRFTFLSDDPMVSTGRFYEAQAEEDRSMPGENSSLRSSFSEEGESDEDISSDQSSGQSNQALDVPVPATQNQQTTSGKPTPGSLRRSKRLQNKRA